jgi:methyl-accepting chemotaxis protein
MIAQKIYKRKLLNFSVKREMQFRMIGKILLLLVVSLFLSSLIFYLFSDREVTSSYKMFHIKARNFLDFLLPAVAFSFLFSLIVGAIACLFLPKSIAGGVYRIEQDLKKIIAHGDLTLQIKLRNGDQLVSLAAEINTLLQVYRDQIIRFDKKLVQLERVIYVTVEQGGVSNAQEAKQACEQMREELSKLNY